MLKFSSKDNLINIRVKVNIPKLPYVVVVMKYFCDIKSM